MNKRILYLIEQAGSLMHMPRSHIRHLGNSFDTVASHSFHVGIIAYCVARMEGLSESQAQKAVTMALFHDLAEARTGDFDFVAKHYGSTDEERAVTDQFSGMPFGDELVGLMGEYEKRESLESKCAKDADSLEQMYLEWVLSWQGNAMAKKWFESDFKDRVPALRTESAKKIAHSFKESHPQEWWWSQFTDDGDAIDKEKLIGKQS